MINIYEKKILIYNIIIFSSIIYNYNDIIKKKKNKQYKKSFI